MILAMRLGPSKIYVFNSQWKSTINIHKRQTEAGKCLVESSAKKLDKFITIELSGNCIYDGLWVVYLITCSCFI